ncbi:MAG: tetratricopeptide repeat protein [candidate division SR1 bacterium]|nr:tetratricopeptide repeat protein [candidate division SR1 bacterium]
MSKLLAYAWIALTVAMIVIPLGLLLWRASRRFLGFIKTKAQVAKENKEMQEIKEELQEQENDFISNNYSTEVEETKENPELDPETEEENLEPKNSAEDKEKNKKKLETILIEANILKNSGKFEQYEKKLIEGLAIDDESLEILKPLSELYFTLGNYKKALSLLKKVSEKDPNDHKAIWQIGEIYFMAGYNQTAELLVEKAINLKNDNPKYYLTMVEIFYNTNRSGEALAYMEKIVKLRPTNPKYLLATAELYEQVGDLDNAKKYYFNVLEYEQNNEKAKAKIREFTREI